MSGFIPNTNSNLASTSTGLGASLIGVHATGKDLETEIADDRQLKFASEALITARDVSNLVDGTVAFHTGTFANWVLMTTSASNLTHEIISSSTGTRKWIRQVTASQIWMQTWFAASCNINASTGNDETGDGSVSLPLATWAEARKRLGCGPGGIVQIPMTGSAPQALTVNFAAGSYNEVLDLRSISGHIDIYGAETTSASGTMSAYTAQNRASTTPGANVATAAFDFTTYLKQAILLTSGASSGARAVIESIPSANHALVVPFATQDLTSISASPVIVTPVGTETFDIRTPSTFFLDVAMDHNYTAGGLTGTINNAPGQVYRLNYIQFLGGTGHIAQYRIRGRGFFNSCRLYTTSAGVNITMQVDGMGIVRFNRCAVRQITVNNGADAIVQASLLTFGFSNAPGSFLQIQLDSIISNGQLYVGRTGVLNLGDISWNNTTASLHAIDCTTTGTGIGFEGGFIYLTSGTGVYGVCSGATTVGFKLGKNTVVNGAGITPVLSTTGANVSFGSTTKTFTQAAAGFFDIATGAPAGGENFSVWQ